MKTKRTPKKEPEPDWKALALEARDHLVRAITHFKLQGPGQFIHFDEKGDCISEHWRDMFATTLEKFPGVKINRELLHAASWTKKERDAYKKEKEKAAAT